jgi:hypothetical protein
MALKNPDDDRMDREDGQEDQTWPEIERRESFHDRQRQCKAPVPQCSEHSANAEFFRSVSTKQNWVLCGVAALLASMAYLLTTQISDGKTLVSLLAANITNVADIRELQTNQARVMQSISDFERWKTQWEAMERFAHGTGVESHHIPQQK